MRWSVVSGLRDSTAPEDSAGLALGLWRGGGYPANLGVPEFLEGTVPHHHRTAASPVESNTVLIGCESFSDEQGRSG